MSEPTFIVVLGKILQGKNKENLFLIAREKNKVIILKKQHFEKWLVRKLLALRIKAKLIDHAQTF